MATIADSREHGVVARVAMISLGLMLAAAPVALAGTPATPSAPRVVVTGTCGEAGLVGEITDGVVTAKFRSCTSDGLAKAALMDADGRVLAEYDFVIAGTARNVMRIGGVAFDPDAGMPEPARARLLELLRLPPAPLFASLPDSLLALGFCDQRPAFAALMGLGFLFEGE